MSRKQGVYVVSKIRHLPMWKKLRGSGFPIISSWIDDGGPDGIDFSEAWPRYLAEAASAAALLVYVPTEDDRLKGGLFEIGSGLGGGATVVVVGEVPELKTAIGHDRILLVDSLTAGISLVNEILSSQYHSN